MWSVALEKYLISSHSHDQLLRIIYFDVLFGFQYSVYKRKLLSMCNPVASERKKAWRGERGGIIHRRVRLGDALKAYRSAVAVPDKFSRRKLRKYRLPANKLNCKSATAYNATLINFPFRDVCAYDICPAGDVYNSRGSSSFRVSDGIRYNLKSISLYGFKAYGGTYGIYVRNDSRNSLRAPIWCIANCIVPRHRGVAVINCLLDPIEYRCSLFDASGRRRAACFRDGSISQQRIYEILQNIRDFSCYLK